MLLDAPGAPEEQPSELLGVIVRNVVFGLRRNTHRKWLAGVKWMKADSIQPLLCELERTAAVIGVMRFADARMQNVRRALHLNKRSDRAHSEQRRATAHARRN